MTNKKIEEISLHVVAEKLKASRKAFYWTLPIVFVVSLVLALSATKMYTSQISITIEDQLSIEQNRVYTHHHPENYDLAVMRTDHAIGGSSYQEVINGQGFCMSLLNDSVQTADGHFAGTMREYLQKEVKIAFWKKPIYAALNWMNQLKGVSPVAAAGGANPDRAMAIPTKDDVILINMLKGMISCDIDEETGLVIISTTAQDNLVAMMLAEATYMHLLNYVRDYQFNKMEIALRQLEQVRDEACDEYLAAKNAKSPETERLESIFRSFERQVVVYKAQMMWHPAMSKLKDATISYESSNSNPLTKALGITLLFGLLIAAWVCRKELMAWF